MTFDAFSPVIHAKTPKNADAKGNFRTWFRKCGVLKTRRHFETLGFQKEVAFENSGERLPRRIRSYHKRNVYPGWPKNVVMLHACEIKGATLSTGLYSSFHLCTTHSLSPTLSQHNYYMFLFRSLLFSSACVAFLKGHGLNNAEW